jgi:hypothetical protein
LRNSFPVEMRARYPVVRSRTNQPHLMEPSPHRPSFRSWRGLTPIETSVVIWRDRHRQTEAPAFRARGFCPVSGNRLLVVVGQPHTAAGGSTPMSMFRPFPPGITRPALLTRDRRSGAPDHKPWMRLLVHPRGAPPGAAVPMWTLGVAVRKYSRQYQMLQMAGPVAWMTWRMSPDR